MDQAISFDNVGKRYVKYDDVPLLLTRALRFTAGKRRSHLWALRNVDLKVDRGEAFGVIGRNGAGKSTMLRMLAGVTAPTEGVVRVTGRVAPLLAVGVGFHRELTGRENIYVNGVILGLPKSEIDRRFDSIVEFAEIAEFIDTPVKFYSSGMFLRLGFSVAVASHPDVLLIDEVLAVGDLAFQTRCHERMDEIRRAGTTVVVVSHNLSAIRRLCDRTMVLNKGRALFSGATDEAISVYHDVMGKTNLESGEEIAAVQLQEFAVCDADGKPTAHIESGDELWFRVKAQFHQASDYPTVLLRIYTDWGQLVYGDSNVNEHRTRIEPGGVIDWDIRLRASLPTGGYTAEVLVAMKPDRHAPMTSSRPVNFYVSGRRFVLGTSDLEASFVVSSLQDASEAAAD